MYHNICCKKYAYIYLYTYIYLHIILNENCTTQVIILRKRFFFKLYSLSPRIQTPFIQYTSVEYEYMHPASIIISTKSYLPRMVGLCQKNTLVLVFLLGHLQAEGWEGKHILDLLCNFFFFLLFLHRF